jgi:hypothetical protein
MTGITRLKEFEIETHELQGLYVDPHAFLNANGVPTRGTEQLNIELLYSPPVFDGRTGRKYVYHVMPLRYEFVAHRDAAHGASELGTSVPEWKPIDIVIIIVKVVLWVAEKLGL